MGVSETRKVQLILIIFLLGCNPLAAKKSAFRKTIDYDKLEADYMDDEEPDEVPEPTDGGRQMGDEEIRAMGMGHILVERDKILAKKKAEELGIPLEELGPPPESAECKSCKEAMLHMQREFDLDEIRSNYKEVELYLKEVCDDMEGWLKKDAVAWCRRTMAEQRTNIMISGLVQMYPGNIVESVCAMGLKLCDESGDKGKMKFEVGDSVKLKIPHVGCLNGMEEIGEVLSVGLSGNTHQIRVQAEACESWYPIDTLEHKNKTGPADVAASIPAETSAAKASASAPRGILDPGILPRV